MRRKRRFCRPWSRDTYCSYERVKFYISGADVPGEGELKCIDWLKRMSNGGSENENAVIVGGDADLILQGLALTEVSAKQTYMWFAPDKSSLLSKDFAPPLVLFLRTTVLPCTMIPSFLSSPLTLFDALVVPAEEHIHLFSNGCRIVPPVLDVGSGEVVRGDFPWPVGVCQE